MVVGKTKPVNIEEEMQSSYLDYAMSVIVSRALPDVRDGLKPVGWLEAGTAAHSLCYE